MSGKPGGIIEGICRRDLARVAGLIVAFFCAIGSNALFVGWDIGLGWLVRNGGTLQRYRADEEIDLIFREFVNTPPTPEGVKSFVERWGQLGEGDPDGAEPVWIAIDAIRTINRFVDVWADLGKASRRLNLEKHLGPDGLEVGGLKFHITVDRRTGGPRIQAVIPNLLVALWLRLFELILSDNILRRCEYCGVSFTTGVGTGRRLDARFCSGAHRIAYHNKQKSALASESEPDQPRRRGRPRKAAYG